MDTATQTGRCDNGTACNATGNICGSGLLPDGGTLNINASQNCCNGKKDVCKVDSSGIPRCFGGCDKLDPSGACADDAMCPTGYTGEEPCCAAEGAQCNFKDECCGGRSCLPNPDGPGLTCQGTTCDPVGTLCQPGSDACCSGLVCRPNSEVTSACLPPLESPDAGTPDGGTDGGDACSANGVACATGGDCCSEICTNGVCGAPAACQPEDGACTSGGDCCQGLQCAPGEGGGMTCQPGATCSAAGQACTAAGGCCSGLICLAGGNACDGSQPCACAVVID